MPLSEKVKFKEAMNQRLSDGPALQEFLITFTKIDSKHSKASVQKDKVEIGRFIETKLGGFNSVDQNVADAMRK